MFGASRPALGVLVVPAPSTDEKVVKAKIREVNADSVSYAHILDALVIILPTDVVLPKTSKGSVVRPRALVQYASAIEAAYAHLDAGFDADLGRALFGLIPALHRPAVEEIQVM